MGRDTSALLGPNMIDGGAAQSLWLNNQPENNARLMDQNSLVQNAVTAGTTSQRTNSAYDANGQTLLSDQEDQGTTVCS